MDRLDRMRAFVSVAERGSFAATARALRVSPTAVTRAVAALEATLGAQLLRRTTRAVRLTETGEAYLDRVRRALADLDDAARAVAGGDAEPKGVLVVSAAVVFGRLHVLPVVADLLALHPGLDVRLTLVDRNVRLVEEGVDAAVRVGDLPDSTLRAVLLGEVRRVLVASPAYLTARGVPTSPAALGGHDLIAFDHFSRNGEWRLGPGSRGVVRLRPRLETNSVDASIEAAVLGCGIAHVLDYQVSARLAVGALVEVLPGLPPAMAPVHVLHAGGRQPSPAVRAFVAAARRRFTGSPPG